LSAVNKNVQGNIKWGQPVLESLYELDHQVNCLLQTGSKV